MEPGLSALVDRLLDRIADSHGGDLIEDFASAIPVEIIGNLLGVPHADRSPLRGWSLAILGALGWHCRGGRRRKRHCWRSWLAWPATLAPKKRY